MKKIITHSEAETENTAFELGALISISCAAVFGGIVAMDYLLRRRKAMLTEE